VHVWLSFGTINSHLLSWYEVMLVWLSLGAINSSLFVCHWVLLTRGINLCLFDCH
jgi:hypothetical protein